MTGHMCPECGGERAGRPGAGCACGATGTNPHTGTEPHTGRDARTAEMAAAEDFDPLRIRPYVKLDGESRDDGGAPGAAATTMPLFLDGIREEGPRPDSATAADETRRRSAAAYAGGGPDPVRPRRRGPFAVLAVGAAVAAVVGTAAFASGIFEDEEQGGTALPEFTTSAPDAGEEPAASVSPSAPASASASASPSETAEASPSASPTPSRSPSASPTASASASPSASVTAEPSTVSPSAAPPAQGLTGATLRRGDRGAEVSELQRRLREIWVYRGPENGTYSEQVEQSVAEYQRWVSVRGDAPGVYGPETRRALEAQTTGQGRRD
ncbi:peptidoglycan-binding domain-containing protein [Streptomyces sp. NPDC051784]|uniref:peptidoglycan-binding domain-containing protein n=1 Tax=Streptomyces sp. NPDC051784 TaxID=3155805 RepID=UPI00341ED0A8